MYEPKIDDVITLNLPDERTRARIERLVSKTYAIAELLSFTTANKSHNYRKGDLVPCRFGKTNLGQQGWIVVSEKELEANSRPAEVPPPKSSGRVMVASDIFGIPERKGEKKKDKSHAATSG